MFWRIFVMVAPILGIVLIYAAAVLLVYCYREWKERKYDDE